MELTMQDLRELLGAERSAAPRHAEWPEYDFGTAILVADRGFVWVGDVRQSGGQHIITRAAQVRLWGTTRGLGELVTGPTPNTKLDHVGRVIVPDRAVIAVIPAEDVKWASSLR